MQIIFRKEGIRRFKARKQLRKSYCLLFQRLVNFSLKLSILQKCRRKRSVKFQIQFLYSWAKLYLIYHYVYLPECDSCELDFGFRFYIKINFCQCFQSSYLCNIVQRYLMFLCFASQMEREEKGSSALVIFSLFNLGEG